MSRPRLLDLFCCEGGAATGYHRAGFDVQGVDIEPQPNYPYEFHLGDAMDLLADGRWIRNMRFVAIHASPPCQSYTTMSNRHGSNEPELIAPIRDLLKQTGLPYVIENVCGARRHMRSPLMLHGGQFALKVWRPRLFESNVLLMAPPKAPRPVDPVAVYGVNEDKRGGDRGRILWTRDDGTVLRVANLAEARDALDMPWASWNGVREAIPPAYTEYVGTQLLAHLGART